MQKRKGRKTGIPTLGGCLNQTSQHKAKIVARVKAMPESARRKGRHARPESRLLASRRNPQVDVVAQPVVRIHVPPSQIRARILRKLNAPRINVLEPVPRNLAGDGVDAVVAQASQDTRPFSQGPYAVKLEAGHHASHVNVPDTLQKRLLGKSLGGDERRAVSARERNKQTDPDKSSHSLDGGWRAAARNLALLTHRRLLRWVDLGGDVEHARIDPSVVLGVIESRACKQRGKKQHVGRVIDQRGQLLQGPTLLGLGQLVGGKLAVGHVPAKGRKLHDENHLGARDVDNGRVVVDLAVDVADGHVTHDEDEADPRHVRAGAEVFRDGVGAASADEERDDAIPQIEQADEVEERYTLVMSQEDTKKKKKLLLWRRNLQDDEQVLQKRLRVRQALEKSSQRIREQERKRQLD